MGVVTSAVAVHVEGLLRRLFGRCAVTVPLRLRIEPTVTKGGGMWVGVGGVDETHSASGAAHDTAVTVDIGWTSVRGIRRISFAIVHLLGHTTGERFGGSSAWIPRLITDVRGRILGYRTSWHEVAVRKDVTAHHHLLLLSHLLLLLD